MNGFFYIINLSNFDVSKVNDMGFMFYKCYILKIIKEIKNFNANQVTKWEEWLINVMN